MCLRRSDVDSTHGARSVTSSLERYLLYLPQIAVSSSPAPSAVEAALRLPTAAREHMDTRESEPALIPLWNEPGARLKLLARVQLQPRDECRQACWSCRTAVI